MKLIEAIKNPIITLGNIEEKRNTVVLTEDKIYLLNHMANMEKRIYFNIGEVETIFFEEDESLKEKKDFYVLFVRVNGNQYPFQLSKVDTNLDEIRKLCRLYKNKKKKVTYVMKRQEDLFTIGHELSVHAKDLVKTEETPNPKDKTTNEKDIELLEEVVTKTTTEDKVVKDIEPTQKTKNEGTEDTEDDTINENNPDDNELVKLLEQMEIKEEDVSEEPVKKEDSLFEKKEETRKKKSSLFGWGKKKNSNTIMLDTNDNNNKKDQ